MPNSIDGLFSMYLGEMINGMCEAVPNATCFREWKEELELSGPMTVSTGALELLLLITSGEFVKAISLPNCYLIDRLGGLKYYSHFEEESRKVFWKSVLKVVQLSVLVTVCGDRIEKVESILRQFFLTQGKLSLQDIPKTLSMALKDPRIALQVLDVIPDKEQLPVFITQCIPLLRSLRAPEYTTSDPGEVQDSKCTDTDDRQAGVKDILLARQIRQKEKVKSRNNNKGKGLATIEEMFVSAVSDMEPDQVFSSIENIQTVFRGAVDEGRSIKFSDIMSCIDTASPDTGEALPECLLNVAESLFNGEVNLSNPTAILDILKSAIPGDAESAGLDAQLGNIQNIFECLKTGQLPDVAGIFKGMGMNNQDTNTEGLLNNFQTMLSQFTKNKPDDNGTLPVMGDTPLLKSLVPPTQQVVKTKEKLQRTKE